jgi:hypothetical protein
VKVSLIKSLYLQVVLILDSLQDSEPPLVECPHDPELIAVSPSQHRFSDFAKKFVLLVC